MKQFFARPTWKKQDIIRDIKTGKPYLVLQVILDTATIIVDMNDHSTPSLPLTLLPRDYSAFALDHDMDVIEDEDNTVSFALNPVVI